MDVEKTSEKITKSFEMESHTTGSERRQCSEGIHRGNNLTDIENCFNQDNVLSISRIRDEVSGQPCSCLDLDVSDDEIDATLEEALEKNNTIKSKQEISDNDISDNEIYTMLEESLRINNNNKSKQGLSDNDISDSEICAMLEQGLETNNTNKSEEGKNSPQYKEYQLLNLEELCHNQFGSLPKNWIFVTHKPGMPFYLHLPTGVCTPNRPFNIGQASPETPAASLSDIPCLQFKKGLEEEAANMKGTAQVSDLIGLRPAKIETAEDNKEAQSLTPSAKHQYCKSLVPSRTVSTLQFNSRSDRQKIIKEKTAQKKQILPTFPDGKELNECFIPSPDDVPDSKPRDEWMQNTVGKCYVCILRMYIQQVLQKQPSYEYEPLKNPRKAYAASVLIDEMRYGYGTAPRKYQAKLAAATAALEILVPAMREIIQKDNRKHENKPEYSEEKEATLSMFDQMKIVDSRVTELCAKTTQPLPYSVLATCLRHNSYTLNQTIERKTEGDRTKRNEFVMTVGRHTARVPCRNKKEGRQIASQLMLQKLHPYIFSWGSLLRLYGNRIIRDFSH